MSWSLTHPEGHCLTEEDTVQHGHQVYSAYAGLEPKKDLLPLFVMLTALVGVIFGMFEYNGLLGEAVIPSCGVVGWWQPACWLKLSMVSTMQARTRQAICDTVIVYDVF